MKTIRYARDGIVVADLDAEEKAKAFLAGPDDSIVVASAIFVEAVRVHIAEGLCPHDDVAFAFGDKVLRPNKNGSLAEWPEGFCDTWDNFLNRIVLPNRR